MRPSLPLLYKKSPRKLSFVTSSCTFWYVDFKFKVVESHILMQPSLDAVPNKLCSWLCDMLMIADLWQFLLSNASTSSMQRCRISKATNFPLSYPQTSSSSIGKYINALQLPASSFCPKEHNFCWDFGSSVSHSWKLPSIDFSLGPEEPPIAITLPRTSTSSLPISAAMETTTSIQEQLQVPLVFGMPHLVNGIYMKSTTMITTLGLKFIGST